MISITVLVKTSTGLHHIFPTSTYAQHSTFSIIMDGWFMLLPCPLAILLCSRYHSLTTPGNAPAILPHIYNSSPFTDLSPLACKHVFTSAIWKQQKHTYFWTPPLPPAATIFTFFPLKKNHWKSCVFSLGWIIHLSLSELVTVWFFLKKIVLY